MKILLSWLLDHLDATLSDINVEKLIHLFNTRTAEIESYTKFTFDHSRFFMVKIIASDNDTQAICSELNQKITLPKRTDAQLEKYFMVVREETTWRWATLQDFSTEKEGLMPSMYITKAQASGTWKKSISTIDYILEIDNKSINHRPDLWGHYGIAREISAFLDLQLKPLDLTQINIASSSKNFSIKLLAEKDCSRVAGLLCNDITPTESIPWIAIRLAQVGVKPMNGFVDLTNFVMFDIGHPMHVFDAQSFPEREMIVRMAKDQETIELLDAQKAELLTTDIVIANHSEALSLPGVMGGKKSGFNPNTKSVILEAAGLDPLIIRKTAQRLKIRTESCMRFEKHLDPMQNVIAIQRFVFLAQKFNLLPSLTEPLVSVGQVVKPISCNLLHTFIESKLGTTVTTEFVQKVLTKLGFNVTYDIKSNSYTVIIPTNRMTKDIQTPEDLVEEIIRSYGFENIPVQLPLHQTQPHNTQALQNIDHIKRHLAFGLHMHEISEYLLYDNAFIQRLDIDLSQAIQIKNSMSENWTTLVTSLIPHLLKSVETNMTNQDHLRFFEFNRTWHTTSKQFVEQKTLSGIIFDKKSVDFYRAKSELQSLFDMLKIKITWQKPSEKIPAWFDVHQVAEISTHGKTLGFAGIMSPAWMHKIAKGSAFIFELNGNILEEHPVPQIQFQSWSKFQDVDYDISLFVPVSMTLNALQATIQQANPLITTVKLLDFFEKEEWPNQRALTLRYTISNPEKTMTKQELAEIMYNVEQAMVKSGAKIR